LKMFFMFLGLFAIFAFSIYISFNLAKNFNYNGLDFERVKEGEIIFYNTQIPLYSPNTGEKVADFNIYLRNDPRELDKIPFNGEIDFRKNMVLNMTDELNCDGKGVLAVANILNLYNNVLGTKIIQDENASCDDESRYMYLDIRAGANSTEVLQTGDVCYQINVRDCEVLAGAEKFILESILEIRQRQED
ncbi:hypothetical protein K9L16_03210, partial [Candidatus Pacearchaeota archaeon]|nr:hypothetical protein [Candidatus Pacearchaeota archaeon]